MLSYECLLFSLETGWQNLLVVRLEGIGFNWRRDVGYWVRRLQRIQSLRISSIRGVVDPIGPQLRRGDRLSRRRHLSWLSQERNIIFHEAMVGIKRANFFHVEEDFPMMLTMADLEDPLEISVAEYKTLERVNNEVTCLTINKNVNHWPHPWTFVSSKNLRLFPNLTHLYIETPFFYLEDVQDLPDSLILLNAGQSGLPDNLDFTPFRKLRAFRGKSFGGEIVFGRRMTDIIIEGSRGEISVRFGVCEKMSLWPMDDSIMKVTGRHVDVLHLDGVLNQERVRTDPRIFLDIQEHFLAC